MRPTFVAAACLCGAGILATAQALISVDVNHEKPGSEPTHFIGLVGSWVVQNDGYRNILMEDGRKWKRSEPVAGLDEKVRTLFGAGGEGFLNIVKSSPVYPFAVAQGLDDFRKGVLWVRFKLIETPGDQSGGLLFNLKPNGDYLAVEYNGSQGEKGPKEGVHHLALWSFTNGQAKLLQRSSEEIPLGKLYSTMYVTVEGTRLTASINDRKSLEYTLPAEVSGRVGVWCRGDSVTYFDDYRIAVKWPGAPPMRLLPGRLSNRSQRSAEFFFDNILELLVAEVAGEKAAVNQEAGRSLHLKAMSFLELGFYRCGLGA